MELAFNLLFLAISLCGVSYSLLRPANRDQKIVRTLLILGCALLLLFPSVSLTDDLHATSDALEDVTFSARKAQAVLLAALVALPIYAIAVATPSLLCIEWLADIAAAIPESAIVTTGAERAPPLA